MLLFERINTGKVHGARWKRMTVWLQGKGKRAPVVHGVSKNLKWAVGICNCPGAASWSPASAGQTLLTGGEGGPAYKYPAILPLQQQEKHQLLTALLRPQLRV